MYTNSAARCWQSQYSIDPAILPFHKTLPEYNQTPLRPLPNRFTNKHGLPNSFIKDESHRFGLPAYKILGASWGCYRAVTKHLKQLPSTPLSEVRNAAKGKKITFCTATDGNWGRAMARMGAILGCKAQVYVPKIMAESTREKIRQEGARVVVVDGDYDKAVREAEREALESEGLLIEDTAWEGYEEIPQWVVDGYSTMMVEIDEQAQQLVGKTPDLVIVPIGVGSLGQATVAHFKSQGRSTKILTVEPDTAACLKTSLERKEMVTVETEDTAMCGMNCGTVSTLAWPTLLNGVDASITVSDAEAEEARNMLVEMKIEVGPCAAASLAALVKACKEEKESGFQINPDSVVVLLGTEGPRGPAFDQS